MQHRLCSRLLTIALLLPFALVAQGGTAVWSIHGNVPDSLNGMIGMSNFDLTLTLATDGQNASFILAPGPEMIAGNLEVDLSATQLQVVARKDVDSIAIGVVLPPHVAALLGGGIGFRFDLQIPDSLPLPAMFDSLETADTVEAPQIVNTGRTDKVAGLNCEVWTVASAKSPDTPVELCLTSTKPTVIKVAEAIVGERYSDFVEALKQRAGDHAKPFGGRELFPIRARLGGVNPVTVELTAISDESPPASYFQLPADLSPLPAEILEGLKSGFGAAGMGAAGP